MAISHVKSNAVGDFTGTVTVFNSAGATATVAATDLVRPSDWNSAHNFTYTLSGNTLNASTASGTNVVYAGSGGVSLGGSTGTIVFSCPVPVTMSSWAPFEVPGLASSTISAGNVSSGIVSFWPVTVDNHLSAGAMNWIGSWNWITSNTSSGRCTFGLQAGLYTRGTGTNSTTMGSVTTASFSLGMTVSSSSITASYPASTDFGGYTYSTTSTNGLNISSLFTGLKVMAFPVNTLMTPGVYWVAMLATNSTTSNNHGWSISLAGASSAALSALAPLNRHTSDFTTGTGFAIAGGVGGPFGFGHGSWTSAGQTALPASVAFSAMTAAPAIMPFLKFWST